jgi:hypothetical protein
MRRPLFFGMFFFFLLTASLSPQNFGFGFGGGDDTAAAPENGGPAAAPGGLTVSGEISAAVTGYTRDYSEGLKHIKTGNIFSGALNFSAAASMAEGVIKLNLKPEENPVAVDEAYVRVYLGKIDVEAGLRKLTWGKADSFGPLDVVNPLDSSEIFPEMADSGDLMGVKIARPLIHASGRFGQFSKLEALLVPNFEPSRFAAEGRWAAARGGLLSLASAPDTTGLDYAQAGLRFTTTLGSSDWGAQYYYGFLPQPAVKIQISPYPGAKLVYNPYHQIGLDYAQVLYGFNLRAELAANITGDTAGDDGSVYNPAIAWSLGFDRDLFLRVNLNVQVNETIRLLNHQVGNDDLTGGGFDIEGGTDLTATRIMATLSRKFLRDELELRAALVWGVEDQDFVIMPALIWTKNEVKIACSAGVFGGDPEGQLGQYHQNHFIKIGIAYTF